MLNVRFLRFLKRLRSHPVREFFAQVVARLCVASIVGAAWLFYIGGLHARLSPWALLAVGAIFFLAALVANPEE